MTMTYIKSSNMIKKAYQKPTVEVVQLQQRQHILSGSEPKTLQGGEGEGGDPDTWYDLD